MILRSLPVYTHETLVLSPPPLASHYMRQARMGRNRHNTTHRAGMTLNTVLYNGRQARIRPNRLDRHPQHALHSADAPLDLNSFSCSGVHPTQICVSFTDNVVGVGLTAEDCGIVNNSRLTITFIDEVIRPPADFHVMT